MLLAITSPIWVLPIVIIGFISAGMYDMYKELDKLLWSEE